VKGLISRLITVVLLCVLTSFGITSRYRLNLVAIGKDPRGFIAKEEAIYSHSFTYHLISILFLGIMLLLFVEAVSYVLRGDWIKLMRRRD
jgi:hypothetical protein